MLGAFLCIKNTPAMGGILFLQTI
ncbi:hypothetical protein IKQ38_02615 [Candidatus Saccharibacteria bacterium]|nr:hypothetical protein [Candidatus Saccharibacteria bacterium]